MAADVSGTSCCTLGKQWPHFLGSLTYYGQRRRDGRLALCGFAEVGAQNLRQERWYKVHDALTRCVTRMILLWSSRCFSKQDRSSFARRCWDTAAIMITIAPATMVETWNSKSDQLLRNTRNDEAADRCPAWRWHVTLPKLYTVSANSQERWWSTSDVIAMSTYHCTIVPAYKSKIRLYVLPPKPVEVQPFW